jgi:S-DNA-T family DNA segregation ATPase FtsK/SpoIIIE
VIRAIELLDALPLYGWRLLAASPRGTARGLAAWWRWVFDTEAGPLRRQTVDRFDPDTYLLLSRQRNARVRARLRFTGVVAALSGLALLVGSAAWPGAWQAAVLAVLAVAGWLGRREDKPIVTPANLSQAVRKLTADVVARAFVAAVGPAGVCPATPHIFRPSGGGRRRCHLRRGMVQLVVRAPRRW